MNRDKIQYIHIPKTGGTFVLNCLYSTNNLSAEHIRIQQSNKIVLSCIRNPYNFYESFFNFFNEPNHKISNKFQYIAKEYNNIDIFINDILFNKTNFFNINNQNISSAFDKYYFNSTNNYGILTNYLLYFFGYKNGDIEIFIKKLKNKVNFLKTENLKNDLIDFCKQNDINYNKEHINKYINKNKIKYILSDSSKKIIYEKEILIFKYFYNNT